MSRAMLNRQDTAPNFSVFISSPLWQARAMKPCSVIAVATCLAFATPCFAADDPPIWLSYGPPPVLGQDQKDPTHTANFGVKLQEKCKSVGVECELVYQGAPDVKHATAQDYLIATLRAARK